MKTISLKLPDTLRAKLERASKQRKQSKSEMVRIALEQYLEGQRTVAAGSVLDAAKRWIGCVEGPGDLARNPKHMEGFGQ